MMKGTFKFKDSKKLKKHKKKKRRDDSDSDNNDTSILNKFKKEVLGFDEKEYEIEEVAGKKRKREEMKEQVQMDIGKH